MGRMIDALADEHDVEVVGRATSKNDADPHGWREADVAIDFSSPSAVPSTARAVAARNMALVIGTTGWQAEEAALRRELASLPIGIIAAPNFAIGVNVFFAIAERSAQLLVQRGFAPWIHEAHHAAKKDAPSGTALALQKLVQTGGAAVDMSSTRAGHIPGTHTVGFDSPAEMITLTHAARDRTAFARGALVAAHWIRGRRGWFSMKDLLDL
jgi:4-hydroxy-tetrahydrodipicolinate reductase